MTDKDWRDNITKQLDELTKTQIKILVTLGGLEIKSGVWGAVAGMIPVVLMIALFYMKG